jgi:N-acetylneuraminate lyase
MLSRHLRRVLRSPHRSIAARRGTASRAAIALGRNRCSAHGAAATACVAAAAALLLHDDDDAAHCDAHAFAGQWCAVVTEFDACGAATTKNVDRYAAHLKREGCVGVFVCGTSGESMSLSMDERERLAEAWATSGAQHGLRVIVHVGCDAPLDAERLARHAAARGVAGVAAMAPRFVKAANADALADYCASIARAAPATPFFYYHFPLATGVATKPSDLVRAALAGRIPNFAGMKFSDSDMWEYGECCDADADGRLAFLPGFEAQTLAHLPYHPRESYGTVSLSFSLLAPLHRDVADAFYAQRGVEAHALQATSRSFFRAVTPFGWTQAVKLALVDRGILDSPLCRAPSRNLSPDERDALRRVFRDLATREPKYFGGLVDLTVNMPAVESTYT